MEVNNTKIIKRYQNRKLYDTDASCYVTLDEIAKMVQQDTDVTVVDNRSQTDITASIFTQIVFEKQKRSDTAVPLNTLKDIIKHTDGTLSSFLTETTKS